jgi:hypothetical protein
MLAASGGGHGWGGNATIGGTTTGGGAGTRGAAGTTWASNIGTTTISSIGVFPRGNPERPVFDRPAGTARAYLD